jgi:hypothetical protein
MQRISINVVKLTKPFVIYCRQNYKLSDYYLQSTDIILKRIKTFRIFLGMFFNVYWGLQR